MNDILADAPLHPLLAVDGPGEDGAVGSLGVAEEPLAKGPDEEALEHVEGEVGDGEEVAGVEERGGDVGEGVAGEE